MAFVRWWRALAIGAFAVLVAHPARAQWFEPSEESPGAPPAAPSAASAPPPEPAPAPVPPAPAAPESRVAPAPPTAEPAKYEPWHSQSEKPVLPYRRGDEIPPGYHVESRLRWGFIIPGGILFGLGYGLAIAASLTPEHQGELWLIVPVLGPFASMLHHTSKCRGGDEGDECRKTALKESGAEIFLLALQAPGAAFLLAGFASPKLSLVRDDHVSVDAAPVALPGGGTGLGVVGQF